MRNPSAKSLRQREFPQKTSEAQEILARFPVDSLHLGAEPDLSVGPVLVLVITHILLMPKVSRSEFQPEVC